MRSKSRLCRQRVLTDQLPSVADFLVAVSFVSTQGRHTPALTGYFTNPCRSNAGLGQESRWLLLSSSGISKDTILYSKLVSMKSIAVHVFLCLFSGVALPRRVALGSIQIGRVSSILTAKKHDALVLEHMLTNRNIHTGPSSLTKASVCTTKPASSITEDVLKADLR